MGQMDFRVALVTAVSRCSQLHLALECGQTHDLLFVTSRTRRRRWAAPPPIMFRFVRPSCSQTCSGDVLPCSFWRNEGSQCPGAKGSLWPSTSEMPGFLVA